MRQWIRGAELQTIALHDQPAYRWEPKTLRLQLFSLPGQLARHARVARLHLPRHPLGTPILAAALDRLKAT